MENSAWREFYDELNSSITILSIDHEPFVNAIRGEWPVIQFNKHIFSLANNFIGECTTNAEKVNHVPEPFTTLLFKLNFSFKQQFGINFPDGDIPFPLKYGNVSIPKLNTDNDPLISVVISKIYAFGLTISFLKTQLNLQPQSLIIQRNRKRVGIMDFHSKYSPKQLSEILYEAKIHGFISDDTDQMNFIDIFSGRPAVKPINWTCTVYSLNKFIKGINGKGLDKITDGKWLVTSQLFTVFDKSVVDSSLCRPSAGKNDRLKDLKSLINYFNNPD